jgi:hypothetical protein
LVTYFTRQRSQAGRNKRHTQGKNEHDGNNE